MIAETSATQLTSTVTPCRSVVVRSLKGNAAPMRVGGAAVTASAGEEISPGDSTTVGIDDVSKLYVIGNGTDKVSVSYLL